jgi:phosphoglycolate phosphatase
MSEVRFPVRAVAIDLDGTLLDTVHDLSAAVNLMLSRLGLGTIPKESVRTMIGRGIPELIRRVFLSVRARAPDEAEHARAIAVYEDCYARVLGRETVPFPGVAEGLEQLASAGFGLACVTNKAARFTRMHLDKSGFAHYFSLVVSGDSLPAKKPDPLPLLHIARHFAVAPKRLLMLGDSITDTQAARAAGCPILCVPYGYNEGRPARSLDCDGIVASLQEVFPRIRFA